MAKVEKCCLFRGAISRSVSLMQTPRVPVSTRLNHKHAHIYIHKIKKPKITTRDVHILQKINKQNPNSHSKKHQNKHTKKSLFFSQSSQKWSLLLSAVKQWKKLGTMRWKRERNEVGRGGRMQSLEEKGETIKRVTERLTEKRQAELFLKVFPSIRSSTYIWRKIKTDWNKGYRW